MSHTFDTHRSRRRMHGFGLLLAALATVATVGPAAASSLEIVPFGGYRAGGGFRDSAVDANRDIREHSSFGIALSLDRSADSQWELSFGRQNTSIEAHPGAPAAEPLDLRIDYLQFGGTYYWAGMPEKGVAPYLVGGLGITRFSPTRAGLKDRTEPSMNLGLGLRVPLGRRVALRIEGRSYVTLLQTDGSIFCKSDAEGAACTIHARADGLWQFEGLIGIAVRL